VGWEWLPIWNSQRFLKI